MKKSWSLDPNPGNARVFIMASDPPYFGFFQGNKKITERTLNPDRVQPSGYFYGGIYMGLFSRKPKIRFETITVERERDVFRALEKQGYILCDDPFQFDAQKSAEKLRKDARSIAKELNGELIVEIYDPIYHTMPWKGLRYAVWRNATREELVKRAQDQQAKTRPNYKDTMGSYDDIARKLDEKKIHVSEEDLRSLDVVMTNEQIDTKGDMDGKLLDELKKADSAIQAITTFNPYDHQGEMGHEMDEQPTGPVFEKSMDELSEPLPSSEPTPEVDAISLMQSAAPEIATVPEAQPPATVPDVQLPATTPTPQPPAMAPPSGPPAVAPQPQPPANVPPSSTAISPLPTPPESIGKDEDQGK